MFLRDCMKKGFLMFFAVVFAVVIALVVGLAAGWWLLDVGVRGLLVGCAWIVVIVLLMGITDRLNSILSYLRAYSKGIAEAHKEMDDDG